MPFLDAAGLPLRILQLVLAIITLGLSAHLVHLYRETIYYWYNDQQYYIPAHDTPGQSRVNYMLFSSLWTILVLCYFIPAHTVARAIHHPMVAIALDAVTMIFWLAAFIALAVLCHDFQAYYNTLVGLDGLGDSNFPPFLGGFGAIREMQADVVFGAFLWLSFVVTTALSALGLRGGVNLGSKTNTNVAPHTGV